jgi:hypothetical protein
MKGADSKQESLGTGFELGSTRLEVRSCAGNVTEVGAASYGEAHRLQTEALVEAPAGGPGRGASLYRSAGQPVSSGRAGSAVIRMCAQ